MKEKFLPIGTICKVKSSDKTIMITGYLGISNSDNAAVYDYSGCGYPEGILASNILIAFNHSEITEILSEGYRNEAAEDFIELLKTIDEDKKTPEQLEEKINSSEIETL